MATAPILDLQQDPPKPRNRRLWIWLIVGGAWGILGQFVSIGKLPPFNGLLFIPALYAAIAIHEVGHLVAGKLAGMNPGGIAIGGFLFCKSGRNWVFKFDYRRLLAGGFAKPLPPKGEFHVAPFAWMAAGGPLASILSAAIGAWFGFGSQSETVGTFFWTSALIVVTTLVPYSTDANKSDGARILLLLRRPEEARAWIALLMIMAEEAGGALPRDWDPQLCALALAPVPDAPESSYVQLLAYYRSLDLGREEDAISELESCLARSAKSGKLLRHCFFLEAACASAGLRKNVVQARTWIERARKLRKPESTDGTEAGIAICERRYPDALRHIANVRAFLDRRKLDGGLARFLRERLDLMERECRDGMAAAPTDLSASA
jgi:hypothetical protein